MSNSVILASASYDRTIRFWDALSGVSTRSIQHQDSQVNRLEITSDKQYLVAAGNPKIRFYDIRSSSPSPTMEFEGHTDNVTSIAFEPDRRWMVSSSEDGTVKVWDVRTNKPQRNYKHGCAVNEVVIHPNQGELIACDQSGHVRIWDLSKNVCTVKADPEDDVPINSLTVASDGSILIVGNNRGNCYIWRMVNSKDATSLFPATRLRAHSKYITRVMLSSDVRHLATCSADNTCRTWSTENDFTLENSLQSHERWVWDCAFSADSAYMITASSDHYLRLWDLNNSEIVRQYSGHTKSVVCVALNDV